MKRLLQIQIDSGETTCYSDKGKPCPHVRVSRMGTRWTCALFNQDTDLSDSSGDGSGWLLRWKECMLAELKDPDNC